MALHNVQQLKESVAGLLTGVNLDDITNLDTALSRAARWVAQKIDAPEAVGNEPITLYGGVYYYKAPDILFGTAITLIRPQGNAVMYNQYNYKVPMDVFTRGKFHFPNGYMLDLEYEKGVGIIGITSNYPIPQVILDPMTSTDGWVIGDSGSDLFSDTVTFYNPPASLRFNANTGTDADATLTKTISSVDLSAYEGVGVAFIPVWLPSVPAGVSITLRIGNDDSNYIQMSSDDNSVSDTPGFLGDLVANQWNLIGLSFSGAGSAGTVDFSDITYLQAQIDYGTGNQLNNVRFGGVWVSLPSENQIIYQTAAIFLDETGATAVLTQEITSDNNTIILNDAAFSILELESAKTIALQQSGGMYTDQIKGFDEVLQGSGNELGLYAHYRANNPSQQLRTIDSYYD